MRDPQKIDRILDLIKRIWSLPDSKDLSLTQLILEVLYTSKGIFYVEDTILEQKLNTFLNNKYENTPVLTKEEVAKRLNLQPFEEIEQRSKDLGFYPRRSGRTTKMLLNVVYESQFGIVVVEGYNYGYSKDLVSTAKQMVLEVGLNTIDNIVFYTGRNTIGRWDIKAIYKDHYTKNENEAETRLTLLKEPPVGEDYCPLAPTRSSFPTLLPEGDIDINDEVELDMDNIKRPFDSSKETESALLKRLYTHESDDYDFH